MTSASLPFDSAQGTVGFAQPKGYDFGFAQPKGFGFGSAPLRLRSGDGWFRSAQGYDFGFAQPKGYGSALFTGIT